MKLHELTGTWIGTYLGVCALGVSAVGCGSTEPGTGDTEMVGEESAPVLSGATAVSTAIPSGENASEAVIAITYDTSNQMHTIVTANADHPGFITFNNGGTAAYGDDTRRIARTASMMKFWHRVGNGAFVTQRLSPPTSWGALWGDPAIAAYGRHVYATNVAIPNAKWPRDGLNDFTLIENGDVNMSTGAAAYLGGGCVAYSNNYGASFSIIGCVNSNFDAYDGSAVLTTDGGNVFSAFFDVDRNEIHVWRSFTPGGALSMTPNPFPGKVMHGHPRLQFADNHLLLMATDSENRLWLTSYVSQTWRTPVLVASNLYEGDVTLGGGMKIRQNDGFAFHAAVQATGQPVGIRFAYTKLVGSKTAIQGGLCSLGSGVWSCSTVPNWVTNTSVNCFHPAIASFMVGVGPGVGAARWKLSYQREHSTGGSVAIYHSNMNNVSDFTTANATGWQRPCPDVRGYSGTNPNVKGGYWGDYDGMVGALDGFHRVFSDSSDGPCIRRGWTSNPVSISEAVIPLQ